jgi:hypothetical protein
MATLVLTTIGGAIGGPVGAMLGGLLGQRVDREVFKPKGREGPRLTELKVQTSSYGTPIPQLFGTLRVAGSVIWATDLIEHRHREGGKGRPTTTSYSYTASFAVALSARPIIGVGRIWADGKLLRGEAGDWKASTGFRLHHGSEDQAPDPLIASAEGIELAPAHRGIAYAVFEDLDLTDFGNRIPSLTFEVIADAADMTAGEICSAVAKGRVNAGEAGQPIGGFSAYGDSQRAVVEPLVRAVGGWPVAQGESLALAAGTGPATSVRDLGGGGAVRRRDIATADAVPRGVTLSHYDPARDYQAGLQQAWRPGGGSRVEALELPAALSAGAAKGLAEASLTRAEAERERRVVSAGWRAMTVSPGERVTIEGEPGMWRVAEWSLEQMAITLVLVPIVAAPLATTAAAGRFLPPPDLVVGETVLHGFELPHLGEGMLATPRISIAACGTGAGWRRAALAVSSDGGVTWQPTGATALPAIIGAVETPAGVGPAEIEDLRSELIVELMHGGMALHDADLAGLDRGANLALVGDELLQFGEAQALGGNRWRLRRLWRGRRGTEAAIGTDTGGDRFVLIEPGMLAQQEVPAGGGDVRVMAVAPGSTAGVECIVHRNGSSVVPPSPVGLRATANADGSATLTWVRRSRIGWRWIDEADMPMGEEAERYQLRLVAGSGGVTTFEVDAATFTVPAHLLEGGGQIEVRQAGDHGLSPPAFISVP